MESPEILGFCEPAPSYSICGMSLTHPLTTTTFELPGFRVTKSFGVVRGIIVRSRSIIGNFGASIQSGRHGGGVAGVGANHATGIGQRHTTALAAADCEPNLSPSGQQCTTQPMLAAEYAALLAPASQQLTTDAVAYTANETDHLAVAEAALTAEAATERALGRSLAAFPFPPGIAPIAKGLIQANQARATLTAEHVILGDGPNSLFHPGGTAIVIHQGPDDYKTDPSGASGDRVACGSLRRRGLRLRL